MKVTLMTVGKIKHDFFLSAQKEYFSRFARFCDFEIVEIPDEKRALPPDRLKAVEAEKILRKIPEKACVIALDENGRSFSAEKFSSFLGQLQESGKPIVFLIGGNFGLSPELLARADHTMALSPMTMTADLARVVFLENLFRGFTILHNIPFHK